MGLGICSIHSDLYIYICVFMYIMCIFLFGVNILFAISNSNFVGLSSVIIWLSNTSAKTLAPFFFRISTRCNNKSIAYTLLQNVHVFMSVCLYVCICHFAKLAKCMCVKMKSEHEHKHEHNSNIQQYIDWCKLNRIAFKCNRKPTTHSIIIRFIRLHFILQRWRRWWHKVQKKKMRSNIVN